MLEKNITTVAGNSKLLPLSKIVSTRKFQKIEYHSDNLGELPLEEENMAPATTGTLIDFLTRIIVLNDDDAFGVSARGVGEMANDDQKKRYLYEAAMLKALVEDKEIDDLDDDVFNIGVNICAWEQALRGGYYFPPQIYPNDTTMAHYKVMLKRVKAYLEKIGNIIRTGYGSATANGLISGDGDYLSSDTLIDFKVSKHKTMQPNWVRQLFLYRVLLRDELVSPDQIKKLMIYNPRRDEGYLLDLTQIDYGILDFVKAQAEKRSLELMGSVDENIKQLLDLYVNRAISYEKVNLNKQELHSDNLGEISGEGESLTTEQLHQILLFLVDYCYINKESSLNDANKGAGIANQIDDEAGKKLIEYEHAFKRIPIDGELPDEFFVLACQIGRYIIANADGKWVDINANDTDIEHLRILFGRISRFLQEKGMPTRLRVEDTGFTGTDLDHFSDVKEEPFAVDLATDSWALEIGLKDGDQVDADQVKNLKGAEDAEFSEVGIISPRSDNYFYKFKEHNDDEFF